MFWMVKIYTWKCVSHILNRTVKDELSIFDKSIDKVRNVVKYVRQVPAREMMFMDCAKYKRIKTKNSLMVDIDTRCGSIYELLDVAEKYERSFSTYNTQDPRYKIYLKLNNDYGRPTC